MFVLRRVQRRGFAMGRTCPSCGTALPTALPVCGRCKHVGRVHESTTHHELLGIPDEPNPFVVDTAKLRRMFLDAQRLCHPDGWATKSEADKEKALAVSNAVNTAYKTLLSPTERIAYLLRRHGRDMSETDRADPALVTEVLEAREAIEASDGDGLARLRERNEEQTKDAVGMIARAVGELDWASAEKHAVRLRYLDGVADAIRRAENEF